jgi:hypothetical protein
MNQLPFATVIPLRLVVAAHSYLDEPMERLDASSHRSPLEHSYGWGSMTGHHFF